MIRDIEIKKLRNEAIIPEYAKESDAGLDLVACITNAIDIPPTTAVMIPTGLAINMSRVPEALMAIIVPRSGKGAKEGKVLGNLIGVIDEGYQGELMVSLWNRNNEDYVSIIPGEKFAQLIFVPIIKANFIQVEEFSTKSARGIGGFGSTGG